MTVTNVNEAPKVTGPAAVDYAENATGAVAAYAAANPEDDAPIVWAVGGTDARRFAISSTGVLTFKAPPDFELPRDANQNNIYEITITASDGNLSAAVDVTVTVTNVNEAPTIAGLTTVDYAENSTSSVATYTAANPESDDSPTKTLAPPPLTIRRPSILPGVWLGRMRAASPSTQRASSPSRRLAGL